jgi:D-glycero-alpha-D-manno-heptose-7-phosphate kinase
VEDFLGGRTRSGWIEANRAAHRLASHIREGRWEKAASSLRDEVAIRRDITPEAFTSIISRLIKESEALGCGARFAGAGGGGSVWALGETNEIEKLRGIWEGILRSTRHGRVLECAIDPDGVRIEGKQENPNKG